MMNGKIQILFMTVYGFLTVCWKNLFKEQKEKLASQTQLDLQKKEERSASEYWAGTHTSKKKDYPLKGYPHNLKQERFFHKLKLKVRGLVDLLRRLMENLFGVVELVFVTLTYVLLLLLLAIANLVETCHQVLSRGLLMFLPSNRQKERS